MKYIDGLFKRNQKPNKNEENALISQLSEPSFELITIGDQELRALKRVFEPFVKEAVKEAEKKGLEPEKIYKAIIPPELVEGMKNEKFQFMKSTDGSLLPNIVDEKNQIIKKIRVEEMELSPKDFSAVSQLSDKILNRKLDAISNQLDIIIEIAAEINKHLQNKMYAKVIGAIRTINQSYLNEGRNTRQQLQNNSQSILNESIAVLEMEMEDGLRYFKDWDKRFPIINKYTSKQIEQKFNKLMEDYLFLNNAKSALIDLKRTQGMSDANLRLMTEDLKKIDVQLKDAGIRSWLPPQTDENKWQHDLINQMERKNARIVIDYKLNELLEEGSESEND
ncbi:hypothetical protein OZ415_04575 [Aerococcus urinaeequi]|uniref:Uncharacterized protein n=1 Tax=Aerococcus urinaeequi TaxID=51665 RepID=A0AA47GCN1_9LACT|nr:hypothetical protein [Aerococcus urinaeequi]WAT25343.1 hypothetical protein OZ415_04575 [Aerococcus urinaeequi]